MNKINGRVWIGLIFIILGTLMIMDNIHLIYFDLFSWPVIFIVIGAVILANSKDSTLGYVLIVIGGIWLSARIFNYSFGKLVEDYWPFLLVLLGLFIIFNSSGRKSSRRGEKYKGDDKFDEETQTDQDEIDVTAILSSRKIKVDSKNFQGGKMTCVMGGAELDLVYAELKEGRQILDVVAIFGGFDIYVPKDWNINIKVTSIFGGFSDKRRKDSQIVPRQDVVLEIKGFVLFGGGDLKSS